MAMNEKQRRAAARRRREVAVLEARADLELLERLEREHAPAAVRRELRASIERRLAEAEGAAPAAGAMRQATAVRGAPARRAGAGVFGGTLDRGVLSGYAAVFGSRSEDLGGFFEVIKRGAFARTLSEKRDIKMLFDHDSGRVMASTAAGTLRLWEDEKGLAFEARVGSDRHWIADEVKTVERGDLSGMSFGFFVRNDQWAADAVPVRTLLDVDLNEVSAVAFPAYAAAWVAVGGVAGRSTGAGKRAGGSWQQAAAARRREVDLLTMPG